MQAIPDECKGILDGRIYIVTDHLLAATVPETQSATASIASHDSEPTHTRDNMAATEPLFVSLQDYADAPSCN